MRAMLMLAMILSTAVPAIQAPPPPPPRPPDSGPVPKGIAVVRGRVTSAETGRPLRRAQVRFQAPELPQGRTVSTDLLGEYELLDLPAGRYTITVQRSGHLPTIYGQRRPGEPGMPVEIADGQKLDKVNIALQRAGIITGRIMDESGEPVSGAMVWALQPQFYQGRRQLVPTATYGRTDDTGYYRILSVPPGDYVVMATLRETWISETDEKQTLAYMPSYFGGTSDPAYALRVEIGLGQTIASIDFNMVPGVAAKISGTAFGSDGAPLGGSSVLLLQETMGPAGGTMSMAGQTRVASDGTWTLKDIGAGHYRLQVSSMVPGRRESASMPITVHGTDIDSVVLMANGGGFIAGEVVVEGGGALPVTTAPLRVITRPAIPMRGPSTPTTPGEDDGLVGSGGAFLRRSMSGPVLIRLTGLPSGWAIKGIEVDDRDHADVPMEVRGGRRIDNVRVVITNQFPSVTGRITDERGAPADGTVLLFPADSEKWLESAGSARSARPDQSGLYRFESVRPGDYLLVAVESMQQWQVYDPEFLEQLRGQATKVTLTRNEAETVNLTLER